MKECIQENFKERRKLLEKTFIHLNSPPFFVGEKFNYRIKENQVIHEVTATFKQYPIKLACAVTIHKSQGQTFENVILDLDTGSFAHGQTYVALSRVVSLEGLYLTRKIKMSDVIFNQNLQEYLV